MSGVLACCSAAIAIKQGFCLGDRYRDSAAVHSTDRPNPVFRHECGKGNRRLVSTREGISVGYGDIPVRESAKNAANRRLFRATCERSATGANLHG